MRFVMFYHSLVSDWNHGNAHFLRGVVRELQARGHDVRVLEPLDGWSRENLVAQHGIQAIDAFGRAFPDLASTFYDPDRLDLDEALDGADVVLVHEWTDADVVGRIGRHRARGGCYRLLFHDTHHRAVTDPSTMAANDYAGFDGVLAFGEILREVYLKEGWARRAWTWHEAADTTVFKPLPDRPIDGDLVWIGNWGDEERSAELREYLLAPVAALGLSARIHGVRYPEAARQAIAECGASYAGWLPNHMAPEAFARFRVTVHVPRRPYVEALRGIPTIRVFEALACGIPLISAPWLDTEGLFRPGRDFLIARTGADMTDCLGRVLADPDMAAELAASGLETIRARHTCKHRVDELLGIIGHLGAAMPAQTAVGAD